MPSTLDDRTFESATQPTPEEQATTKAHFEAKGYEVELVPEEGDEAAAPPVETVPPAAVAPPVADPAAPVVDDGLDTESRADWQSATNDGERLGKYAKRTKQLHELKTKVADREAEVERLKTELATRTATPPVSAPPLAPPVATPEPPKPAAPAPAPITAKQFEKPEPTEPTLEQFAGEDDPHAAFAAAGIRYAKELRAFDREKAAFDASESTRVAQETDQQTQQANQLQERQRFIQTRFEDAKREHPDLEQKTANVPWPSAARYLLTEQVPDGFKLGYELAKPENREILNELIARLPETKDPNITLRQIQFDGPQALAVAEYRIKNRVAPPPAPAPPAAPPASQVPPPDIPPRREEAAPIPTRGHAVPSPKPEDINPMDSDERRRLRGLPSAAVSVPKRVN